MNDSYSREYVERNFFTCICSLFSMSHPLLSWRVPTVGDPRMLRVALAQVGLASVVAALVLLMAVPREWLAPGLLGLIPLAIAFALSVFYLVVGFQVFQWFFRLSRRAGTLLGQGE